MPSRPRTQLLSEAKQALDAFTSAPQQRFRIVRSFGGARSPRTLFILDSSYNPPTRAHAALAAGAAHSPRHANPRRLLLLFSTHNADKAPGPAPFEHRLAMMLVLGEELADRTPDAGVDVGLTTEPIYAEKSAAIEEEGAYAGAAHVHVVGFDTVVRIFNPRYYPNHNPPLSALDEFFEKGHGFRVTVRADEAAELGDKEEQMGWLGRLEAGELEDVGGRREWADRVEVVEGGEESEGVSSTAAREAAGQRSWEEVRRLCSGDVEGWIEEFGLYGEERKG